MINMALSQTTLFWVHYSCSNTLLSSSMTSQPPQQPLACTCHLKRLLVVCTLVQTRARLAMTHSLYFTAPNRRSTSTLTNITTRPRLGLHLVSRARLSSKCLCLASTFLPTQLSAWRMVAVPLWSAVRSNQPTQLTTSTRPYTIKRAYLRLTTQIMPATSLVVTNMMLESVCLLIQQRISAPHPTKNSMVQTKWPKTHGTTTVQQPLEPSD